MTKKLAWLQTKVRAKRACTPSSITLVLENTVGDYLAGQHVDVRLVAEDGYEARRSYSLTSIPGSLELELLIERLPEGEVSPFLADELQPGDVLEIRGPIGNHFTWAPSDRRPLVLVAGGSGIAPLMSMVRHRSLAPHPAAPALLLYSARSWQHMAFAAELEELAEKDSTLSFVAITTREPARRRGDFDRRIDTDMLTEIFAQQTDLRGLACFVCGATDFVETVATALVRLGMAADSVKTERYGGT
ncbi:FAD-binding oxidoreductase [Ramlibacter sp. AN1133]|uniref:FAD-binding oxidoreductase n=1 Tax=Ramlibacter sp. AN1133 TaxID=3133429 RepID=UPI0030C3BB59